MQVMMHVTKQSLRSAPPCQSGRLCVDIPATHEATLAVWTQMPSTAYPLVPALTVAMSYHPDYTFRFSSPLAPTNFSRMLMLDDRASSEKTSGRRAWAEKTSCSPQSHDHDDETRLSVDGRNPRPESLVVAAHGRDEYCWHVTSKHNHLLSTSHGIARCFRTRETWLSTRRCNCTDQPQPLFQEYSKHQQQLHVLLPTSPQLQLCH